MWVGRRRLPLPLPIVPRYFVDRMLGANKFDVENPDQRAFNWQSVVADMTAQHIGLDGETGAVCTAYAKPGGGFPLSVSWTATVPKVPPDPFAARSVRE